MTSAQATNSPFAALRGTPALLAAGAAILLFGVPEVAAQDGDDETAEDPGAPERKFVKRNPLDGQPPVRHRKLLVKRRFEVGPAFESSVNADFMHTPSAGLKLEFHLSDMLSIGAVGFYGFPLETGLTDRIVDTLPNSVDDPDDPTPSRTEFEEHLNRMPMHAAGYVTLTPWYGKLAAFGSLFVHFDFYFSGGLAVAQLENDCCSFATDPNPGGGEGMAPDDDPNNDPALNDGLRLGLFLGGGIHVFLNDFIALDLTVRDYLFSDNPSGLDFDADLAVTDDDNRFLNHLFLGAGLTFLLPTKVKRTP
jgi:outer membrane beta-barrel protein